MKVLIVSKYKPYNPVVNPAYILWALFVTFILRRKTYVESQRVGELVELTPKGKITIKVGEATHTFDLHKEDKLIILEK